MTICAVPFATPSDVRGKSVKNLEGVDSASLSHRSLLRNATSAVVTSASALVSQSLMSLNELNTLYVKDAYNLVKLYHEHSVIAGKQSGTTVEDDLWQDIIQAKAELDDKKRAMQEVESVLSSALKVLQSAGEAAYHAGVEYSALEAKTKCQQAEDYLSLLQSEARKADRALLKIQAKSIKETANQEEGDR